MKTSLKLASLLAVGALLGGCLHPLTLAKPPAMGATQFNGDATLTGRIAAEGGRRVQAVDIAADIAPGATVSLIDVTTQYTVGSTVTLADGSFVLRFGASFKPDPSKAYYLEAIKGIKGSNSQYNQAGAEAVRLRTVLFWRDGWVSLANPTPGPITIGLGTTAIAAMLGLKTLASEAVDAPKLIGCIDPTLVGPSQGYTQGTDNPFTQAQYESVFNQVAGALAYDQDPLRYISYNPLGNSFIKTGTVFTLSSISPTVGGIGATVTLVGSNFDASNYANNIVKFNGTRGTVTRIYDSATKLDVTVPVGATSGPVTLEIGGTVLAGDRFTVRSSDGHNTLDAQGRLLVVNRPFNTLSRVTSDGTVTTIADAATTASLDQPRSLTLDPATNKLYVACYGSDKIVRFDYDPTNGTVSNPTDWASVAHPAGLALGPDGNLYVASNDEGVITKFRLSDAASQGTHAGFDRPVGLGFDYQGYLFIAEQGSANRVNRLNVTDDSRLTWGYVSTPWGLAVDSGGNVFVASNPRGAIFRIDPTRALSSYAAVPSPTGLEMDETGTIFVADGTTNRIMRVAPGGAVLPIAYGISNPYGFALDGSNNRYVALSGVNAILSVAPDGRTSQPYAVGIANPYGLAFRNNKLYAAHPDTGGITQFDASGATSYGRGLRAGAYGLDLASDGSLAWGNKYNFSTTYLYNPVRGFDQDLDWWRYPGMTQIAHGSGTGTDTRALLSSPKSIAVRGTSYFVINNDNRLVKVTATGASGGYTLTVLDSALTNPTRVSVEGNGNLLVADTSGSGQVYRYDAGNNFAKAAVGNTLSGVYAVAADQASGQVYAVTNPGNKLYKLSSVTSGTWTEMALSGGTLNQPRGLAVSPNGLVAIADYNNSQVKLVNPATNAVTFSATLAFKPNDVDVRSDNQLVASVDQCGSNILRVDPSNGTIVESGSSGCQAPFPISVDRTTNNAISANVWAQILQNGGRVVEGPLLSRGEVLVHASGTYTSTASGLYRFSPGGQPDLLVNLGFAPQAFAAIGANVYFTGSDSNLYQLSDLATGARTKLNSSGLPSVPRAMDARTDGVLEWVGTDGRLYRMSGDHATATLVQVGLQQPDF